MLLLGSFGDGSMYVSFIIERGTWRLACVVMIDVVVELEMLVIADVLLLFRCICLSIPPLPQPHQIPSRTNHLSRPHRVTTANSMLCCGVSFIIHHQGGGIYVTGTSTVTMTECTISDNTAVSSPSLRPAARIYILITVVVERY